MPEVPHEDPGMKLVTMPGQEYMVKKLEEAGVYGIAPQTDRVLNAFVKSVAGSKRTGSGLGLALQVANGDEFRYPSQDQGTAFSLHFNKVIDAVTPDPEVAAEAKRFMQQAREKIIQEREQAKKQLGLV